MTQTEYKPSSVSPPGETIEDCLGERRIPVRVAAAALGLSLEDTERLLVGQLAISDVLAAKLESFLGVEKAFWLKREETYRRYLFEQRRAEAMAMAKALSDNHASFFEMIRCVRSAFGLNLAEAKEVCLSARDDRALTLVERQGELAEMLDAEINSRALHCALERERVASAIEDAVRQGRLAITVLPVCAFIRAMPNADGSGSDEATSSF